MRHDYVVVGGGTAGAIVAARLSEDRDVEVLLLEAGPDYPNAVPQELLDASVAVTRGHNWDLQALVSEDDTASLSGQLGRAARVFQLAANSRLSPGQSAPKLLAAGIGGVTRFQYPLGKVMGGGSAVNGSMAFHARPEDYEAWAAEGNDGWSWEKVRPYVHRIEGEEDDKPALPVHTARPQELTPCQEAFFETCLGMGHPGIDVRSGTACGVGTIPKNVDQGQRVSTSRLYLAAARQRPNLRIQSRCLVDKLILEESNGALTASGVEAIVDGQRCRFAAGRIVLAAGAIGSPVILMRSGIGGAGEIAAAGGRPLLDLPGVGKNLIDHPAVSLWAVPRAGACRAGEPIHQTMLQQRSAASAAFCDLQLFMLSAVPTEKFPPLRDVVGADLAMGISVIVATPSSRGRVELLGVDPARNPRIYLNCMREASDLRRMMEGLRSAWRILSAERLGATVERVVLWSRSVVESDPLLEKMIRTTVRGVWHPVGTLRMGREGDAMAVVDQYGRLRGCGNVTVADGSIMPALPSVPTNLTCMLIAERIAARLRGQESA